MSCSSICAEGNFQGTFYSFMSGWASTCISDRSRYDGLWIMDYGLGRWGEDFFFCLRRYVIIWYLTN